MSAAEFAEWNESMSKRYDPDLYHRSNNWAVRWIERSRVSSIRKLLESGEQHSVLEVGVGAGSILEQIHAQKRIGIDLSRFLLEKARARLGEGAQLIYGDAETLEQHLPEQSVDRVYCSEVLEHVRNPEAVLRGISSVLKPDGIAVVSVPNEGLINSIKSALRAVGLFTILFPAMPDHMKFEWHLHAFDRQLTERLCRKHFFIEKLVAVPFAFFPIRYVAKLRKKTPLQSLVSADRSPTAGTSVVPNFLSQQQTAVLEHQLRSHGDNTLKNFFKRWPTLYGALVWLIGPSFFTGMNPARFLRKYQPGGATLHAGSGTRVLPGDCINVDISPFPGVDALADLAALPFRNDAFAAVTCDQVLEHVPSPTAVACEFLRVVRPGGLIHIAAPFAFPWHPSPRDYTRWTCEGLRELFPQCEVVEAGVMAGPCSACTAFLAAFFATILSFGSRRLQHALQYVFLIVFLPIKFLDTIFANMPGAELCAANFYVVLRKPSHA